MQTPWLFFLRNSKLINVLKYVFSMMEIDKLKLRSGFSIVRNLFSIFTQRVLVVKIIIRKVFYAA